MLFVLTIQKQIKDGEDPAPRRRRLGFAWMFVAGSIILACLPIATSVYDICKVREVFNRHQYLVVEGTIEQFDPMVFLGHRPETFVVNGVKFNYSDYNLTAGFHHSAAHGGPIHGGEHVRIAYTCQEGNNPGDASCYNPLILRLEIAEPN